MDEETSRRCLECEGELSPIVIMDKHYSATRGGTSGELEYRQPDDTRSFWTGRYPTAGRVQAFMCGECGRIALYGEAADA
jgi:hypothetical protein